MLLVKLDRPELLRDGGRPALNRDLVRKSERQNPRASASSPELYASLEFSGHHGAIRPLFAFHQRRSAGSVHGAAVR